MDAIREVAIMQEKYQRLVDERKLTKKAMCDLCVPFRDKYGLTDLQTLRIARKEMELAEKMKLVGNVTVERLREIMEAERMRNHEV